MGRLLLILLILASVSCKHKPDNPEPTTPAVDTTAFLIKKATIRFGNNTLSYRFTYTADHRLDSVFQTLNSYTPFVRVIKYMPGYRFRLANYGGSFATEDSILLDNDGRPAMSYSSDRKVRVIYHYTSGQLTQSVSFQYGSQGYTVDTTNYTYLNGEVDMMVHRVMDDYGFPEPVEVWSTKYFYDEARPFQMASIPYFEEFRFGNIVGRSGNLSSATGTSRQGSNYVLKHYAYTFDSLNRITYATSASDAGQIGDYYDFYY